MFVAIFSSYFIVRPGFNFFLAPPLVSRLSVRGIPLEFARRCSVTQRTVNQSCLHREDKLLTLLDLIETFPYNHLVTSRQNYTARTY
jgi:hypothetical protein